MPGEWAGDEGCQDFVANLETLLAGFGWSRAELADRSGYSASVVSNILSFQRKPTALNGAAFDRAFKLRGGVFEAKAKAIQGGLFAEAFKEFPEHEAMADDVYVYEFSVFPGLFQTERYARAVLSAWPNITADELDRKVSGRMERQEILFREKPLPPRVWALVDETALRFQVADAAAMYEQCMHALELSSLPHVSLAVIPRTGRWHVGLLGACAIVEREGVSRVTNLDDFVDGRVSEDPALVRLAALRFRTLQAEAMPLMASRDMIARMAEELWNTAPSGVRALTAAATEATA